MLFHLHLEPAGGVRDMFFSNFVDIVCSLSVVII